MIFRTALAAAALLLSAAAAQAACAGNAQLAMAADQAKVELRPAQIEGLRRLYIDLRKTAYDRCARRHAADPMAARERCFRDTLGRLVTETGNPSLARYHGYIDGIARPSG